MPAFNPSPCERCSCGALRCHIWNCCPAGRFHPSRISGMGMSQSLFTHPDIHIAPSFNGLEHLCVLQTEKINYARGERLDREGLEDQVVSTCRAAGSTMFTSL